LLNDVEGDFIMKNKRVLLAAALTVAFLLANVLASPLANFSTLSRLWAQSYGVSQPEPIACTVRLLSETEAAPFRAGFSAPAGATYQGTLEITGFCEQLVGSNLFRSLPTGREQAAYCSSLVAYRVTERGERVKWSKGCAGDGSVNVLVLGTGLRGNVVVYSFNNAARAPQSIAPRRGA
jgi:hypothetical protein